MTDLSDLKLFSDPYMLLKKRAPLSSIINNKQGDDAGLEAGGPAVYMSPAVLNSPMLDGPETEYPISPATLLNTSSAGADVWSEVTLASFEFKSIPVDRYIFVAHPLMISARNTMNTFFFIYSASRRLQLLAHSF